MSAREEGLRAAVERLCDAAEWRAEQSLSRTFTGELPAALVYARELRSLLAEHPSKPAGRHYPQCNSGCSGDTHHLVGDEPWAGQPDRPAEPDAGDVGEGLTEALMAAVFIPGPVRVDKHGAIVLTHGEARRAAARMSDWLAARERKAAEQELRDAADVPTPGPAVLCANPGDRDEQWRKMLRARADRIAGDA